SPAAAVRRLGGAPASRSAERLSHRARAAGPPLAPTCGAGAGERRPRLRMALPPSRPGVALALAVEVPAVRPSGALRSRDVRLALGPRNGQLGGADGPCDPGVQGVASRVDASRRRAG